MNLRPPFVTASTQTSAFYRHRFPIARNAKRPDVALYILLAGMMIDFFCFQSGLVTWGMIDNSGTQHARSCNISCERTSTRWSAHVARSLLHTIHYASSMNAVWRTHTQHRPQTALLLQLYIFSRTRSSSSPSIFTTSLKSILAKLKGLLRVQPSGRRNDEPQRGFISVRYYEV